MQDNTLEGRTNIYSIKDSEKIGRGGLSIGRNDSHGSHYINKVHAVGELEMQI